MTVRSLLLACFAAVLVGFTATTLAQVPAPLPNPNLPLFISGTVQAVVRLSDGSVVIGGSFSSVNGTPRSNIAKLLPDGTLDTAWKPSPSGPVLALAVDAGGNVYAGGNFTTISGQSRNYIAKLSSSGIGQADATWNPWANSVVSTLALDAGGNVFAGGGFTTIGGQSRNYIAKLSGSGTGSADTTWNPSANNGVSALALDGSGNVFAGGQFSTIGGQSRNYITKLSGTGTGAADTNWNPSANNPIYALALDGSGNVFAGGAFTTIGGQGRNCLAKLSGSGTGAADSSWNPSANNNVLALAIDGSGNVFVGGGFTTIGGQNRTSLAKLSGTGTGAVDTAFPLASIGGVRALAIDGGGSVYIGGAFNTLGASTCCGFAVVNAAGTVTAAAEVESPGTVWAFARRSDGGLIAGGRFRRAGNTLRDNLLYLRRDGTLDPDWNPSANGIVFALTIDGSGSVYAGGSFTNIGGQDRSYIAKLVGSGAGAADVAWNPPFTNAQVLALASDGSGNIYAGGAFTTIGGEFRNRIAKLSGSGTGAADVTWNPSANNNVSALALDGSGNVYAGGAFGNIGGQSRTSLAKLSGTGTGAADANWNPSANGGVSALALDGSGNVFAGGFFTTIGGQSRNYIAKLSGSGTGAADTTWNPSADTFVRALTLDGNGNVYAGGGFTSIGGQSRNRIAKLSGSGTGAADVNWNPSANSDVLALTLAGSGTVLAGGAFTMIGGQARNGLAALSPVYDRIFANDFE